MRMQVKRVGNYLAALAAWCCAGLALAAGPLDFHAPGGGPIHLEVAAGDRVTVSSDYWRLEFDLRSGGALSSIVFPHGSGRNLLRAPFRSYVGEWVDTNAPQVELRSAEEGGLVRLVFSGRLAGAGRAPGPVEFQTAWTLSPFVARADHTLRFPEDVPAARVGIASTTVRPELNVTIKSQLWRRRERKTAEASEA